MMMSAQGKGFWSKGTLAEAGWDMKLRELLFSHERLSRKCGNAPRQRAGGRGQSWGAWRGQEPREGGAPGAGLQTFSKWRLKLFPMSWVGLAGVPTKRHTEAAFMATFLLSGEGCAAL